MWAQSDCIAPRHSDDSVPSAHHDETHIGAQARIMQRTLLMAMPTVRSSKHVFVGLTLALNSQPWLRENPGVSKHPATRNRTRDHLIAAWVYSQMLYQLSYGRRCNLIFWLDYRSNHFVTVQPMHQQGRCQFQGCKAHLASASTHDVVLSANM